MIRNIADIHTRWCTLDYAYFPEKFKVMDVDLARQQVFNTDPRAI